MLALVKANIIINRIILLHIINLKYKMCNKMILLIIILALTKANI
jgi:hypothetical protein